MDKNQVIELSELPRVSHNDVLEQGQYRLTLSRFVVVVLEKSVKIGYEYLSIFR